VLWPWVALARRKDRPIVPHVAIRLLAGAI